MDAAAADCPEAARSCAESHHLGDHVLTGKDESRGCLGWAAGTAVLGAVVGLGVFALLGTERVLNLMLVLMVAPWFLLVVATGPDVGLKWGTAKEWRDLGTGCLWPAAAYGVFAIAGWAALSAPESTLADVVALAVCLSLALPGVFLSKLQLSDRDVVHVFEHGLVARARRRLRAFRWDAVTVHQDRLGEGVWLVKLVGADGVEVYLPQDRAVRTYVLQAVADAQDSGSPGAG